MFKFLRKTVPALILILSLSAHSAEASSEEADPCFTTAAAISFAGFAASVIGIVFSVLPGYGSVFTAKLVVDCSGKEIVCLNRFICDPPDAVPCERVTQIDAYHFSNTSTGCAKYQAFCVARNALVTPLTVGTAYHRVWNPQEWSKVLFSISTVGALFSGVMTLFLAPFVCVTADLQKARVPVPRVLRKLKNILH